MMKMLLKQRELDNERRVVHLLENICPDICNGACETRLDPSGRIWVWRLREGKGCIHYLRKESVFENLIKSDILDYICSRKSNGFLSRLSLHDPVETLQNNLCLSFFASLNV